jgi:hypothetical protein
LAAAGPTRADIDTFELFDLAKLPIMTKTQMMTNFGDVVTDSRLRRGLIERHITDSATEPPLILGDYVCLASGGSSGLRGTYLQTPEEYAEFGATCFRRAMAAFIALGGQPAEGLVVGMVGAASPIHSTGFAAGIATGPPVRGQRLHDIEHRARLASSKPYTPLTARTAQRHRRLRASGRRSASGSRAHPITANGTMPTRIRPPT